MPTTSNFGWTTPADTDLVKDGAAAIRTLGNGIDTSLLDLKGGTSGQVLSKNSNTDLDYTWVTPNVGDITEVQAGTGISVASGTGPIPVVTNTVATAIDAKGDLIVGTGADTFARLAVGTNGHTLVADSAETTGLKWAAPAGGSFSGVLASKTGNQSLANVTQTILTFETEANGYDTDGYHSTVTNTGRITIPSGKDGYFWVWGLCVFAANGTGRRALSIFKNGVELYGVEQTPSATASADCGVQVGKAFAAVATDYFELRAYQSSGGSLNAYGNGAYDTQFGAYFLGA